MDAQDVRAVEVLASGIGLDGAVWRLQRVHGRRDALRLVVGLDKGQSVVLTRDDVVVLAESLVRGALAALDPS